MAVPSLLKHQKVSKLTCGVSDVLALTHKGSLYSWGSKDKGVLGLGQSRTHTVELTPQQNEKLQHFFIQDTASGDHHNIVMRVLQADELRVEEANQFVFLWGHGKGGTLGLTTKEDVHEPIINTFILGQRVKQTRAGRNFSAILTQSRGLYTFGDNL